MVEQGGAHADEGKVIDIGSVDGDVVTDGYIVADADGGFLVKRVEHASVLNVHAVADADAVHIATQHGVEPDAALVAHHHIAYDGGVFGQVAVFPYLWGEPTY